MTVGVFKDDRMKKDELLWSLYYAMLEADHIHNEGAGLYPLHWGHARAAAQFVRNNPHVK